MARLLWNTAEDCENISLDITYKVYGTYVLTCIISLCLLSFVAIKLDEAQPNPSVPQHTPQSVVWHSWGSHCCLSMEDEVLSYGRPRGSCCGWSGIQAGFLPSLGFSHANASYTSVYEGMAQWHHVWLHYQGTQSHPTPTTTLIPYECACAHILWIFHHSASSETTDFELH